MSSLSRRIVKTEPYIAPWEEGYVEPQEKAVPSRAVATPDIKKPPEQIAAKKERRPMTAKRKAETKESTTLRLPRTTLEWFRSLGPGWQLTMQDVLTEYMDQQKEA